MFKSKKVTQFYIMVLNCGLKTNDFCRVEIHKDDNSKEVMNVDPTEVQCPENIVRKEEKLIDLDYVINEIQNKFYFLNNKVCTRFDFKSVCVYLCTR